MVGTGQSGRQIAEDLHLAGRRGAPRGRQRPALRAASTAAATSSTWLHDMGYYEHAGRTSTRCSEGVRAQANHYVTGRDGGRDIDLRAFARDGMTLYGRLTRPRGRRRLRFGADLTREPRPRRRRRREHQRHASTSTSPPSGIDAPAEERYAPVWEPRGRARSSLDLGGRRHHHGRLVASASRRTTAGSRCPVFDGRGYPGAPPRRHRRARPATSSACRGCRRGAPAGSSGSPTTPSSSPGRSSRHARSSPPDAGTTTPWVRTAARRPSSTMPTESTSMTTASTRP